MTGPVDKAVKKPNKDVVFLELRLECVSGGGSWGERGDIKINKMNMKSIYYTTWLKVFQGNKARKNRENQRGVILYKVVSKGRAQ